MNLTNDDQQPAEGFTTAEKAALQARARELKAEARANKNREAGESALLATIAQMATADQLLATRLHALVKQHAPQLFPKTWYGMPAYANANGNVICFFQAAGKFSTRYATLGFQHDAALDDGNMWPTSFALCQLTEAEESIIEALLKKAVSLQPSNS